MDIFGPQLQGYQTENPLKSMADVQTLYGNQQIQQKNALMLQQQQQEMQQTNALMQVVRQPGVINQETGDVTPHGQNAMMGVAPLVAPKLIQQMALARQERTKSQVNELQAGMERLRINEAGSKALADAYTGMDEAYKAAVPTMGEQGARNYVNEQIRPDFEKKLKTGGLLPPEVTDKIGGTYDPEKNRIALAAATGHAEMLKQQQRHPSDSILMQSGKDTFLVSKDKGVQAWFPEEQKFVSGKFQLPEGARPMNVASPEAAAAKAGAVAQAQTAGKREEPPANYRWSDDSHTSVVPIKGGPADPDAIAAKKAATAIQIAGGRESVFVNRVVQASRQAIKDIENISKLPLAAQTTGMFGGRHQGPGLFDATKEVLAQKMTSQDAQTFNVISTGLQRALAQIETAGVAQGIQEFSKTIDVVAKEGETQLTKLHKMAQMRQIIDAAAEATLANERVPQGQRDLVAKTQEQAHAAIPFTHSDLIDLQLRQEKNPRATLRDVLPKIKGKSKSEPEGWTIEEVK